MRPLTSSHKQAMQHALSQAQAAKEGVLPKVTSKAQSIKNALQKVMK